jgi:hypothetical protein
MTAAHTFDVGLLIAVVICGLVAYGIRASKLRQH